MAVSRSVVITGNSVPFMRLRAAPWDPGASNFHPIMAFGWLSKTFLKGRYESFDSLQNIGRGVMLVVFLGCLGCHFLRFLQVCIFHVAFVGSRKANCHSTRMVDGTQGD